MLSIFFCRALFSPPLSHLMYFTPLFWCLSLCSSFRVGSTIPSLVLTNLVDFNPVASSTIILQCFSIFFPSSLTEHRSKNILSPGLIDFTWSLFFFILLLGLCHSTWLAWLHWFLVDDPA